MGNLSARDICRVVASSLHVILTNLCSHVNPELLLLIKLEVLNSIQYNRYNRLERWRHFYYAISYNNMRNTRPATHVCDV